MILLTAKVSKISLDIDLKIILLKLYKLLGYDEQIGCNAAKSFDILVFSLNCIEHLT